MNRNILPVENFTVYAPVAQKSAFTPVSQKPLALVNQTALFEPSPIHKFLYYTALAQAQQHQEFCASAVRKVFSPTRVTPTQILKMQATPEL